VPKPVSEKLNSGVGLRLAARGLHGKITQSIGTVLVI
jgi:hypothetical protein